METSLIGKALGFGSKECRFEPYVSKNINNSSQTLVNSYNIAAKKRSVNIKFRRSKNSFSLLKKLHVLGLINSYTVHKATGFVKIAPTYFIGVPYASNLRLVSRGLKSFSVSKKNLTILKKYTGGSIILLDTHKGILTLDESLNQGLSGKILLVSN